MSLSADINKLISDQMFAIYTNAETLMLEKMAKRIKKGITEEGWTERKLKDVREMNKELTAITTDLTKIAGSKLSKAIRDSYEKGIHSAEKDFKLPATILSETHVPAKLQRLVQESNNIVVNSSFKILRNTDDIYRKIQAEVTAGTLTGVETRKQIASRLLNRLADNGITSFTDKRGRNWEMGSYAEMVTRTTTVQASLQGHIDRQTAAGRDLIVISDHAGECSLCRPWENKILSISGTDNRYPSLESAKQAGLFHPNCRHTLTGYIEGLTDLEPHPRTSGEPEQAGYISKQRANERAIRKWKRREIVAIDGGEARIAREKIREYQREQRLLLEEYEQRFGMTVRRKYDRESIRNREGIAGKETLPQWTSVNKGKAKVTKEYKESVKRTMKYPRIADYRSLHDEASKWSNGTRSGFSDIVAHSNFLLNDAKFGSAIETYTGGDYSSINNVMRGKVTDPYQLDIYKERYDFKEYEKLKDTPALSENIILYRHNGINTVKHLMGTEAKKLAEEAIDFFKYGKQGTNESLQKIKNTHVGGVIEDKAVLSTSYKDNVFTQGDGVELRILTPKGFKQGIFAEEVSKHKSEAEFIFKQGQKFRIIDVEIRELRHGYKNISFLVFPIQ